MLLQELQIEGFRSLKSVTWKPGRLNVLIGPNGGGKSNLLGVVNLLRLAATGGLGDAIIGSGGMGALVWDGQAKCIRVRTGLKTQNSAPMTYELELTRLGPTGGFNRTSEDLSLLEGRQKVSLTSMLKEAFASLPDLGTETLLSRSSRVLPILVPEGHPAKMLLAAHEFLSGFNVYCDMRVDTGADIRRATVTRLERKVGADGQNLIAVLHTLYENERNFEEFLDNAMRAAFPDDYDKLSFPPAEHGRTEMRVRRKHRKGTDSPADLSDGTLRFLLLVTILGSTDPAPLIAIDEPETGLHPRMMSIVAEVAQEAAHKTQVIFTTHSPQFLDAFRDEPPTVTVVTSNGSETELKTVGGDELKKWIADYSLGKFAFSGEAEAVL